MKNIIFLFLFLPYNQMIGQKQNNSLFFWFDEITGRENLSVYNGTTHLNYDKTSTNSFRYLNSFDYNTGQLSYKNQLYSNLKMKYDIFEDNLVILPENQTYTVPINVNKEYIDYFEIFNKKFVNLNLINNSKKGFYEEFTTGESLTLYIKHYKKKQELIQNDKLLREYHYNNDFLLFYKNEFTAIKTKKDIITLFPNLNKEINDYYRQHDETNKIKFMTDLITVISKLNQYTSN